VCEGLERNSKVKEDTGLVHTGEFQASASLVLLVGK